MLMAVWCSYRAPLTFIDWQCLDHQTKRARRDPLWPLPDSAKGSESFTGKSLRLLPTCISPKTNANDVCVRLLSFHHDCGVACRP